MNDDNKLLIVYGSLKKGKYNHDLLKGQEYLGTANVHGVMQLNGSYPFLFDPRAVKTPADMHEAEVYRVTPEVYNDIQSMELGAGYYERDLSTEWGKGIVYMTQPRLYSRQRKTVKEY